LESQKHVKLQKKYTDVSEHIQILIE